MKQRVRKRHLQRQHALARLAYQSGDSTKRYGENDYRSRLASFYSEHRDLFKRLEDA